jgi:hypothetical protein
MSPKAVKLLESLWQFVKNSCDDWVNWGNKLKWLFISFKFVAFFGFCGLLISLWYGLGKAFQRSVEIATGLHSAGYIKDTQVVEIVNTSQTLLYDKVIGHASVVAVGVLVAIVGLKALSEKIDGDVAKSGADLKKYLKK